jgi:hypothetical protein
MARSVLKASKCRNVFVACRSKLDAQEEKEEEEDTVWRFVCYVNGMFLC